MAGQRILGRVRLSRFTDESTSIERQKDIIEGYARANDDVIVGWAIDVDVSRSVDPFDTPELGQWFKEERVDDWDKVVSWKLDRLATGSIYLNKVMAWCQDNGKVIVSVTENFDLSHWVGRMIANVIAGVAEGELEAIKERTKGSYNKLLESGRWPGGQHPYGHLPQKTSIGWVLVADPDAWVNIDRMADMAIEGNSVDWIRDELTNEGVHSPSDHFRVLKGQEPKGAQWNSKAIWNTLTSKTLLGHATRDKETVRDLEGLPILYAEPLMSKEKWDRLQDALEKRRNQPTRTRDTSPILGVVFCYDCTGQLMHKQMERDYGKKHYRYYHCASKDCDFDVMMDADEVDAMLEEHFNADLGNKPEQKRVFIRGSDHTGELNEALEAAEEIAGLLATAKSESVKNRLRGQITALDTRIAALEQMPIQKARYDYENTGRTYGEAWLACESPEERRKLLLKYGITARIKQTDRTRKGSGVWRFDLKVPEDLTERMAS